MHTSKKGFSLIEILIVIAIIGVIGAVGVPAYKDYMIRSKVSSVYSIMLDKSLFDLQSWFVKSNGTQFFPSSYNLPNIDNYVDNSASVYQITGEGSGATIKIVFDSTEVKTNGTPTIIVALSRENDASPIKVNCGFSGFDSDSMVPKNCRNEISDSSDEEE